MFFKSKALQSLDLYGELFIADMLTSKVQDIRKEYKTQLTKKCFSDIYKAEDKDEMRQAISEAIAAE